MLILSNFPYLWVSKPKFMRRFSLLFLFTLAALPAFAEDGALADYERNLWVKIIATVVVMLVILVHTIVVTIKQRRLRTNYTVAEFSKNRTDAAQGAMTQAETDSINASLDSIDDIWGEIMDSKGDMVTYPHKHSAVKKSLEILNAAIAANPTDKGVVEKINSYNEVLSHARSRQFNGSKTLIAIFSIIGLIMTVAFPPAIVVVILFVAAYIFASRTPNFMLIEQLAKSANRSGSWVKRALLSLLSGVATAKSYKVVTTYSDGSKSYDTDNSETWFSLAITVIFTMMMAFLMPVVTLINYTRNYLLYR